jgi:hypothetical protein
VAQKLHPQQLEINVSDFSIIRLRTFTYQVIHKITPRKIKKEFSSKNNATYRAIHVSLHTEIIIRLFKLSISKEHNAQHGEERSVG